MIEIQINGDTRQLDEHHSTLAQLVEQLGLAPAALATAVNGDFVPRTLRASCRLQPGDVVTTFQPITGG
jgi:sulfur carrier protein